MDEDPDRTLPFDDMDDESGEALVEGDGSDEGAAQLPAQGTHPTQEIWQPEPAAEEEEPGTPDWLADDPTGAQPAEVQQAAGAPSVAGAEEGQYQPGMTYETETPFVSDDEGGEVEQTRHEQALEEGSSGGRRGRRRAARTQATDLFLPMVLGVGFGLVFMYFIAPRIPSELIREKLLGRGSIPWVCTIFLCWHLSHVLFRYVKRIRPEFKVLSLDLVPASASEIMNEDLQVISQGALEVEQNRGGSILTKRLLLAVAHLGIRRDTAELGDLLRRRAEADRSRAVNSYAVPNFLFWAIPILGFVGTVMGVGDAVGKLKEGLGGVEGSEALAERVEGIAGSLGVAFDTTLVALVMSIAAYLVQTLVRQQDAQLLADVEDYLTYRLQSRISTETSDDRVENIMRESLKQMTGIHMGIVDENRKNSQLTMQTMMNTQQSLRVAIDKFPNMLTHATEASSKILDSANTTSAEVARDVRKSVGQLVQVLSGQLSQSFQELGAALEDSVTKQAGIGQEIARSITAETTAAGQELVAHFRQLGEELQASAKDAVQGMAESISSVGEEARSVVSGVGGAFLETIGERGTEMFRNTAQEFHQAVAPLKTFLGQAIEGLEKAVTEGQRLAELQESLDRNVEELVRVKKVDDVLEGLQFTLASLKPMLERLEEPAPLRLSLGGMEIPVSTGPRL